MNEKFNKNVKVEQLTKMFLSREEEKGLIVKDPYKYMISHQLTCSSRCSCKMCREWELKLNVERDFKWTAALTNMYIHSQQS